MGNAIVRLESAEGSIIRHLPQPYYSSIADEWDNAASFRSLTTLYDSQSPTQDPKDNWWAA
ncbi:hypothetical protein KIN20_034553 [Parelaphostrongylus tenuis]|uniref:Uncharacterized protein n=1 Tax=Parelaphostrongylus tenuis TaxID=148309 RepID=A0AAD5RCR5_PARTN|nr:hypothetical protein KIN20_034553 [Parelaphostrongylus tenuis]